VTKKPRNMWQATCSSRPPTQATSQHHVDCMCGHYSILCNISPCSLQSLDYVSLGLYILLTQIYDCIHYNQLIVIERKDLSNL